MIGDYLIEVGVSVGILVCLDDGIDLDIVLWVVDFVMYCVKEQGCGVYYIFFKGMEEVLKECVQFEKDVCQVVVNGDIFFYYQFLMYLQENCLVGFEVLVCWCYFVCGEIGLNVFILIIEKFGLIGDLIYDLMWCVCKDVGDWFVDFIIVFNILLLYFLDLLFLIRLLVILFEIGFLFYCFEIEVIEFVFVIDFDVV